MNYLLIALIASIIGSISGMGGGIIIKPLLDVLGHYDIATINLLSSFTVLAMAIVSTLRYYHERIAFNQNRAVILSLGAIIGATVGDSILNKIIIFVPNKVKQFQNIFLLILLLLVFIYMNHYRDKVQFNIVNRWLIVGIGMLLGFISTLAGIGGGPINIMILSLFFIISTREVVINSLIIILFSQAAKIINIILNGNLFQYDLTMLLYMIPAGIIGGIVGTRIGKHLTSYYTTCLFNLVLIFTLLTTIYNIIM